MINHELKICRSVVTVNHGHRPRLVILDEPFSGLDPVNVELLIETVKKLKVAGTAIIFSSHNMKNVAEVSDQLLMLVNGNQRLYGPISDHALVKPRSTWKASLIIF